MITKEELHKNSFVFFRKTDKNEYYIKFADQFLGICYCIKTDTIFYYHLPFSSSIIKKTSEDFEELTEEDFENLFFEEEFDAVCFKPTINNLVNIYDINKFNSVDENSTKVTHEELIQMGFKEVFLKEEEKLVYDLKLKNYPHKFRYIKGNYPITNPNCGVLGLYLYSNNDTYVSASGFVISKERIQFIVQNFSNEG